MFPKNFLEIMAAKLTTHDLSEELILPLDVGTKLPCYGLSLLASW
jgi:hypothetical protein